MEIRLSFLALFELGRMGQLAFFFGFVLFVPHSSKILTGRWFFGPVEMGRVGQLAFFLGSCCLCPIPPRFSLGVGFLALSKWDECFVKL
jgi:hypothetical protein